MHNHYLQMRRHKMNQNNTCPLNALDNYNILAFGSAIENIPYFHVRLDQSVNPDKLQKAVREALIQYPHFQTKLHYNKQYFLKKNNQAFIIHNVSVDRRPLHLEKENNGYLWQICYENDTISFEWCHALTDGRGAIRFFSAILDAYFENNANPVFNTVLSDQGLEQIADPAQKPLSDKKQPKGYDIKYMPSEKHANHRYRCHVVKIPTQDVLNVSHKADASPAAVLPPLFSKAVRRFISEKADNRTVSCSIVIDARTPMHIDTMHNCIITKQISYVDRFDEMDFNLVSTIYRSILDLSLQKENVIYSATKLVKGIQGLLSIRPKVLRHALFHQIAKIIKKQQCNFGFSYLGKVPVSPETASHLLDFDFRSWADFGQANMSVIDLNGTMHVNICEEYAEHGVVSAFVHECRNVGIAAQEPQTFIQTEASNVF